MVSLGLLALSYRLIDVIGVRSTETAAQLVRIKSGEQSLLMSFANDDYPYWFDISPNGELIFILSGHGKQLTVKRIGSPDRSLYSRSYDTAGILSPLWISDSKIRFGLFLQPGMSDHNQLQVPTPVIEMIEVDVSKTSSTFLAICATEKELIGRLIRPGKIDRNRVSPPQLGQLGKNNTQLSGLSPWIDGIAIDWSSRNTFYALGASKQQNDSYSVCGYDWERRKSKVFLTTTALPKKLRVAARGVLSITLYGVVDDGASKYSSHGVSRNNVGMSFGTFFCGPGLDCPIFLPQLEGAILLQKRR